MTQKKIYLDIGCGTRKFHDNYIGLDIKPFPNVDIVCDIEQDLPFKDNTVDTAYSNFTFEHISNIIHLFKELYRVSKNHTIIAFRVPYFQSITQYKDPTHKSVITKEMLRYFSRELWYGSDYELNTNIKIIYTKYFYMPPFHLLTKKIFIPLFPVILPFLWIARKFLWNIVHSVQFYVIILKDEKDK